MDGLSLPRSPARLAFIHFLRTGDRVPEHLFAPPVETKFNPYHDPQDGRFTSGPGGVAVGRADATSRPVVSDGVYRPVDSVISLLHPTAAVEPPRGIGDNSGGFRDPMSLEQTFPGLNAMPGGSVLAIADDVLNLTGPSAQVTSEMSLDYTKALIVDITRYDPDYHFNTLGFPDTFDGQIRQINDLRWDRAAAIYRATGNDGPLQVETVRYLQERTDAEYEIALAVAKNGELPSAPTERMAIGNYIDSAVKADFRDELNVRSLSAPTGNAIRVSGREYNSSGSDLTYTIPDARVGDVAYDITLWQKGPTTRQIRNFFNGDFKPKSVVIIKPRQIGPDSTYIIKRPGR